VKVLCPHCERLVELKEFRVENEALIVSCEACRAQTTIPMGTTTAPKVQTASPVELVSNVKEPGANTVELFRAPMGFCPKCLTRKSGQSAACHSCGLDFSKGEYEPERPHWLIEATDSLSRNWNNVAAHQQFLDTASNNDALALAGRVYRVRLAHEPTDAVAEKATPTKGKAKAMAFVFVFLSVMVSAYLILRAINSE
jgi:ribosomal protein L37AE/L43A